jgi:hypothetical protein
MTEKNFINPSLQEMVPPSLETLLDAVRTRVAKEINCVRVGVVQAFDAATQTATVKIAQQQVTSIDPQGVRTLAEYPLLLQVPVQFPSGGGYTLTFPVAAGDECMVLFNDRELDNWFTSGPGLAPAVGRLHDLSDGIAIVGIRSKPRALEDISTTATQLRSDDGANFVEVNPQGVKVHANVVYEWDCHGFGQKITWLGGNSYQIDTYQNGADLTIVDHDISPPGPV